MMNPLFPSEYQFVTEPEKTEMSPPTSGMKTPEWVGGFLTGLVDNRRVGAAREPGWILLTPVAGPASPIQNPSAPNKLA
jgi:hypothetical protein